MKTFNQEEVERFKRLPIKIRNQSVEYYGLLSAMNKGVKLSVENLKLAQELSKIIDEHKITPICFEADLF